MSLEDDTYSTMFTALKHPIRRRILRILNQKPTTYTDIQTQLGIDNGLLNYHLDSMRDLISKGGDGKYSLSEFGRAAISVTEKVEEPAKNASQPRFLKGRLSLTRLLALILIILSVGNIYFIYTLHNTRVSNESALQTEVSSGRSLISQSLLMLNTTLVKGNLNEVPLQDLTNTLYQLSGKCETISLIDSNDRRGDWEKLRDGVVVLSDLSSALAERTLVATVTGSDQSQLVSVSQRVYLEKVVSDLRVMVSAFNDVSGSTQGSSSGLAAAVKASNNLQGDVTLARGSFGLGQTFGILFNK